MFYLPDNDVLSGLSVERLTFYPRQSKRGLVTPTRALVLLGHSASGKSAVLEQLGNDRKTTDMDVYCQINDVSASFDTLRTMIDQSEVRKVFVSSNNVGLLEELRALRDRSDTADLMFIYMKRPFDVIVKNLALINSDGRFHREITEEKAIQFYNSFQNHFRNLADVEFCYTGYSVPEMAAIVQVLIGFADNSATSIPCSLQKEVTMPQSGSIKAVHKTDQAEDLCVEGLGADFSEYFSTVEDIEKGKIGTKPIGISEMRALTSGGYQSFSVDAFPPQPEERSIAYKKLLDLKWTREEFTGRSVLEIGSQLGFFSFHAIALGAVDSVGLDINPRFVQEANRIAYHYKKLCHWSRDMVRFVSGPVFPGNELSTKPDIIVLNSVLHWWIIQRPELSVYDMLAWLHRSCLYGVYFEGCVSAEEPIMAQHSVDLNRYNEKLFLSECARLFSTVTVVGRCTYNEKRIVVRLLR